METDEMRRYVYHMIRYTSLPYDTTQYKLKQVVERGTE